MWSWLLHIEILLNFKVKFDINSGNGMNNVDVVIHTVFYTVVISPY